MSTSITETIGLGWVWLIIALLLTLLEFFAPGIFCIWLGASALLTSLIVGLFELSLSTSLLVFGLLSIGSVYVGYKVTHQRSFAKDDVLASSLNIRDREVIGHTFILKEPIENRMGSLHVHDSMWRITGKDLPKGSKVRVLKREGNLLIVEPTEE